jgi:hypothetical protein
LATEAHIASSIAACGGGSLIVALCMTEVGELIRSLVEERQGPCPIWSILVPSINALSL